MQLPGVLLCVVGSLGRGVFGQRLHYAFACSAKSQLQRHEAAAQSCGVLSRCFSGVPAHTIVGMPALSPTMSQGNIAKWHVKPGQEVSPGSVLADIETDKATLAFENQDEGFVAKLLVPDGARDIPIGQPVLVLVEDASSVAAFANFTPGQSAPADAAPAAPVEQPPAAIAAPALMEHAYPPHTRLTMPSLSPTMDRGNIVAWKVSPGTAIKAGDVLADIETDKATLAYEAVAEEGYVAALLVPEGTRDVAVGTPLALLVEDPEHLAAFARLTPEQAHALALGPQSGQAAAAAGITPPASQGPAEAAPRVVASERLGPAARLLLESSGLKPEDVTPTGPNNIITKADVLAAIAGGVKPGSAAAAKPAATKPVAAATAPAAATLKAAAPVAAATAAAQPSAGSAGPSGSGGSGGGSYTDTPNSQIRRIIAARLLDSKRNTPSLYMRADACLDAVADLRASLAARGTKVSVNDCVLRAVALALRDVPAANVHWDEAASDVRAFGGVDISVAVATERGLITPIVRAADVKGLLAVSREVRALALKAKDNKLKPEEFTGGSFTVSNLGMYGLTHFSAIINPPQAAILAVGGATERVVLVGGQPAVRSAMSVTLSADGRVYDGELAGAVLAAFRRHMEQPYELLSATSS
ncbi:hypothetical protein CHLRE_06g252550v5 [Chlamydomonas reinhardtii]|uniref:Dihydrolipoamide acetyltransferase component of pyruvate dehydrogenase complex n=1 Tax=Chlamydomonas reinhardtii TaxID=3055 RepID=A8HYH4_CHLRE|nr:uncharacterized protein CHLRE_06g252550v5 [Chlamydomonas reinhardtii]ADF43138.1 DLA3p [Chlamydomonas reinhardtii]PNW81578.1 hypothetical protein CHLRE_06g252550v5 [Chlamydomonas reinhardtii]|eukprot:XP_001696403.1 dihydrolipoamide acetyltransferase [Chlamydomonas reinhardtii]